MTETIKLTDTIRICSKCFKHKLEHRDFYSHQGRYRGDCKQCVSRKNGLRAKETKHLRIKRPYDADYSKSYYAKNVKKFAAYREVFKGKHPDYHKEYARKKKNE